MDIQFGMFCIASDQEQAPSLRTENFRCDCVVPSEQNRIFGERFRISFGFGQRMNAKPPVGNLMPQNMSQRNSRAVMGLPPIFRFFHAADFTKPWHSNGSIAGSRKNWKKLSKTHRRRHQIAVPKTKTNAGETTKLGKVNIDGSIWLEDILEKLWKKHRVQEHEVGEIFDNAPHFRFVENGHREGENVYAALGQTEGGRYLIVFFIYKENQQGLIVSAREMTDSERKNYGRK